MSLLCQLNKNVETPVPDRAFPLILFGHEYFDSHCSVPSTKRVFSFRTDLSSISVGSCFDDIYLDIGPDSANSVEGAHVTTGQLAQYPRLPANPLVYECYCDTDYLLNLTFIQKCLCYRCRTQKKRRKTESKLWMRKEENCLDLQKI